MLRGRGTFFTLINAGTVSIITSMDKKRIIGQNRQFSNYDIQYENNFQLIPYNYGVNLTKTGSNEQTEAKNLLTPITVLPASTITWKDLKGII